MHNLFITPTEAADIIEAGSIALFAGSEEALAALPPGRWIGGTTAYFMTDHGGVVDAERLFCTVITDATEARISSFAPGEMDGLAAGQYRNGFTYVIMPAFSAAHQDYAMRASGFAGLDAQPIIGWVSGVQVKDFGLRQPKVFHGPTGRAFENALLAMHVALPDDLSAQLHMINPFTQGTGPTIVFPETGFSARECLVDGKLMRVADYLATCDTRLPLVADYAGTMINVSLRSMDAATGEAQFYAPVVAGEPYRVARALPEDYRGAFGNDAAVNGAPDAVLSCNCVLNFLYCGLEGQSTGGFIGPVTFGEIAYILVNQTLVGLSLSRIADPAAAPGCALSDR
jgi:hypothetical protein